VCQLESQEKSWGLIYAGHAILAGGTPNGPEAFDETVLATVSGKAQFQRKTRDLSSQSPILNRFTWLHCVHIA
jgi:hypothetical protein